MPAVTVTPGMPSRTGVYAIENALNGKRYIGSAVNMMTRASYHKMELRNDMHHSSKLQRAWNKYGAAVFSFMPLLICAKEHLLFYEQRVIDAFDCVHAGYNVLPTAGSRLGVRHSEETRRKLSVIHTGKVMSEAARAKMRARMLGVAQLQDVREKISATMRGMKMTPEALVKLKARVPSAEHRRKISATLMGHPVSLETRERQRIARLAFLASMAK